MIKNDCNKIITNNKKHFAKIDKIPNNNCNNIITYVKNFKQPRIFKNNNKGND